MLTINGFPQKAEGNIQQSVRLYDIKASHRLSKRGKAGRRIGGLHVTLSKHENANDD